MVKKLTKKLFISVMTLILTAIALGTSTFAWFSMNTSVSATNMQVTAKSNATYLLIGTGTDDTASEIQAKQVSQALTVQAAKSDGTSDNNRYPSYFCNASNETLGSTGLTVGNWYTASNAYSNSATSSVQNVVNLGATYSTGENPVYNTTLANYVVKYTVYLTLSADSEPYTTDKYVKLTFNKGNAAANGTDDNSISAVIKIGTDYYKLDSTTSSVYTHFSSALTSTTVETIDILIYINGNSTNVNSDFYNASGNTITGTVGVTFDLTFDASSDPASSGD